jgi:hypothetical protein
MAYACLVYSIDGVKCDDLTVTGINETLAKLTELKAKDVKKKSTNFLRSLTLNSRSWIERFSRIKGS